MGLGEESVTVATAATRDGLLAVGVTLLWTSQLMRVLMLHETFGPYILMIYKMLIDVGKWLVILVVVLVPSAIGLRVTFSAEIARAGGVSALALPTDDGCDVMVHRFATDIFDSALFLMETIFGGSENVFVRQLVSTRRPLAPVPSLLPSLLCLACSARGVGGSRPRSAGLRAPAAGGQALLWLRDHHVLLRAGHHAPRQPAHRGDGAHV